jgi:hypothetical protein
VTGERTWTTFNPLDLWCPECHASPGCLCVWQPAAGPPRSRPCHAVRVSDARDATNRARRKATRPLPGWSVFPSDVT